MKIIGMLALAPLCLCAPHESASARAEQSPGPDTLLPDQVVVTLGNSITELGETPRGYVSLMRRVLSMMNPDKHIIIVNSGISGHKATDMAARFQRDVVAFQPDWVTISVGINDVWHGFDKDHPNGGGPQSVPLPLFREEVTRMIDTAYAHKIRVALFTTTVIQENLESPENTLLVGYNAALREIAGQHHCLLIDQNAAFHEALKPMQKPGMPNSGALTVDGVHMLPDGDWLMARTALVGFGISPHYLDRIRPAVLSAINQDESAAEDVIALVNGPRTLFFGSPVDADGFQNLPFVDRQFVTETYPQQTFRQVAARLKAQLVHNRIVSAVLFLDACKDVMPGSTIPETESRIALEKIFQLASQSAVKLGVVGPGNENASQEIWSWILDSCRARSVVDIKYSTDAERRPAEIERAIEGFVGVPLIGMSGPAEFLDTLSVTVEPLFHAGIVRYTFDGTEPSGSSSVYQGPLRVHATTVIKARSLLDSGGASGVRSESYGKMIFLEPLKETAGSPGLSFDCYEGSWEKLPFFDSLKAVSHGIVPGVVLDGITKRTTNWGAVISGFLTIPADGLYTFYLRSDDGSRLLIDDRMVADNDGLHGAGTVPGRIALKGGLHQIKVLFFQAGGGEYLSLQWRGEKTEIEDIPRALFSH